MGLYSIRPLDRPLWRLWQGTFYHQVLTANDRRHHLADIVKPADVHQ